MHRIDNQELISILIAKMASAPKKAKRDRDVMAEYLVNTFLSDKHRMVIQCEMAGDLGIYGRPGVWGVDEPDPTQGQSNDLIEIPYVSEKELTEQAT